MTKLHIEAQGLSKRYNREWIFRDLTFDFHQGKSYVITGPNGSGKSTLMQILWGQMPPSKGTVIYHADNQKLEDEKIYQQVSVAAPYMELIDEFTLLEQVEFHYKIKPIKQTFTSLQIIESLYLTDSIDKPISNFSSGMKQRVKLGLAFYTDVPILFLDEPGTNLDAKAFEWYHENLKLIASEKLILVASNQKSEYPENAEELDISAYKSKLN